MRGTARGSDFVQSSPISKPVNFDTTPVSQNQNRGSNYSQPKYGGYNSSGQDLKYMNMNSGSGYQNSGYGNYQKKPETEYLNRNYNDGGYAPKINTNALSLKGHGGSYTNQGPVLGGRSAPSNVLNRKVF